MHVFTHYFKWFENNCVLINIFIMVFFLTPPPPPKSPMAYNVQSKLGLVLYMQDSMLAVLALMGRGFCFLYAQCAHMSTGDSSGVPSNMISLSGAGGEPTFVSKAGPRAIWAA